VAGLRSSTLYYFQVRAYQDGGTFYIHSTPSNTATATTWANTNTPSNLIATIVSSSQVNLSWSDTSSDETGFEIWRATGSGSYTRIATTNPNVASYSDTGLAGSTTYSYYVRALNAMGATPASNIVSVITPPPASTWAFQDIGAVGVAGSNNSSGSTITISGSGSDIWDKTDAFRFVYRTWTGDGVVEARVMSMDNTNEWAKAGVMIRETLDANAKNAFLCVTPGSHGTLAQVRSSTGEQTGQQPGPFANAPYWVRLVRSGDNIHRYFSADGVNWIDHGYYIISMATTVYFGFAVTSHDNTRLNTAVFSDPFVGTR
jgi:regulation of enolase protein 1 (concanavalin A-like superfamily)